MKRLVSIALAGLALGCASTPVEPAWLSEARAREAAPLPTQKIVSRDGTIRAEVPAKLAEPVEVQGDAHHLRLAIGTEAPIDCWVYAEGLDTATSLAAFSDSTFEAISTNMGPVDFKKVGEVDAGAIGGSPFLAVSWLYRIGSGDSFQVGGVKHIAAQKGDGTVYCQHNELGYSETFRNVARDLVETLVIGKGPARAPYFTQISTLTIKGMRVGVEQATLTQDGDGDSRVDVRTSLLVPVSSDTLRASDTFAVEFVRPNGDLINQVHVETADGELVSHLKLQPGSDGLWYVEGTFQTKDISAKMRPGRQPSSWLGEALHLRSSLEREGVGSEITLVRWVPQADPVRLIDEKLSIGRSLPQNQYEAKLEMAGLEADLVVDDRGSVAEGTMDMGFGSLAVERVYMSGKF